MEKVSVNFNKTRLYSFLIYDHTYIVPDHDNELIKKERGFEG